MSARRSKNPVIRRAAERRRYLRRKKAGKLPPRSRAYSQAHARKQNLKKYDLTEPEYFEMLAAQNGHCAICPDGPQPDRRLAVDHCHETKRVRGLLCARCNLGLGFFRDNETLLLNAIGYLQ